MKRYFLLSLILSIVVFAKAQNLDELFKKLENELVYPVMKSHLYMGVMPFNDAALFYNPNDVHKIGIDLVKSSNDSSKVSTSITEIGRTFNLHVVNGALKEKIDMVVIVHGPAVSDFMKDTAYAEENGIANPNIQVIKELAANGVKFYVCGQSLTFMQTPADAFVPELKIALSAKTAITELQSKGYSLLYIWPN